MLTRPQILSSLRAAARKLRHAPTRAEFMRVSGIHYCKLLPHFSGYRAALRAAGLTPPPGGLRIETAAMLADWGRLARKKGRVPTRDEYERLGKYAGASLETRFGRWSEVPFRFVEFYGASQEWRDVVEMVRTGPMPRRGGGKAWLKPAIGKWQLANGKERGPKAKPFTTETRRHGEKHFSRELTRKARMEISESGTATVVDRVDLVDRVDVVEGRLQKSQPSAAVPHDSSQGESQVLLPAEMQGKRCVTAAVMFFVGGALSQSGLATKDTKGTEESQTQRDGVLGEFPEAASRGQEVQGSLHSSSLRAMSARSEFGRDDKGTGGLVHSTVWFPRRVLADRPLLGPPVRFCPMAHEPINEMGVVFLFGMLAERMGISVESLQAAFPDCEAKMEVEPGRWQRRRIEIEYESRKFKLHRHDPKGCDMIVCWRHNWKGCPGEIQVVELRKAFSNWQSAIGENRKPKAFTTETTTPTRAKAARAGDPGHGDTENRKIG